MLGNGANQNSNEMYEANFYPRLKFRNDDDKLELRFSLWKGSLKIAISEKPTGGSDKPKEYAYIHLSPTKAKIMSQLIKNVKENPDDHQIYGINTGVGETRGLITISNGNDGVPYTVIGKVDSDGSFVQSQRYNFNTNYHYSLVIDDIQNLSFSKAYHDDTELDQLQHALEDFARHSNGMMAASVWDIGRYELNKMNKLTYKIAEKLGVETQKSGSSYNRGGSNSFFDGNNSSGKPAMNQPVTSGSIDDMESEFD